MLDKDKDRLVDTYREILLSKRPDILEYELDCYIAAFEAGMSAIESYNVCKNVDTVDMVLRMVNGYQSVVN